MVKKQTVLGGRTPKNFDHAPRNVQKPFIIRHITSWSKKFGGAHGQIFLTMHMIGFELEVPECQDLPDLAFLARFDDFWLHRGP